MPKIGETIHVKPVPGLRVLSAPGRFLPADGAEVTWSVFLEERLRTGEITLPPPAAEDFELVMGVDFQATPPGEPELQPRVLAEGEMLEQAPLPAGSQLVEVGPADPSSLQGIDTPLPAQPAVATTAAKE